MKCFTAILLLVLVAVAMAVEKTPKAENIEVTKEVQGQDNARDKRGTYLGAYTYAPYTYAPYAAPIAYRPYSLPYAYSTYNYPYNYYPYNRYPVIVA